MLFFFHIFLSKKCYLSFFPPDRDKLLFLLVFVLNELGNQCITHVNLPLLVQARTNRGLATSPPPPSFSIRARFAPLRQKHSCSFFFFFFFSFYFKAFRFHWSGKSNCLVGQCGQVQRDKKGNVIHLGKLPCFSAYAYSLSF